MSALRIGSVVLRVHDLHRQAEFWMAALGYALRDEPSEDFLLLHPKDGNGPNLALDKHWSELAIPPRFHLDLYTNDQDSEVKRLIALGASQVHWNKRPPDADYIILADPEGNRFCVVQVNGI